MLKDIINEFRKQNGRHPLVLDNQQENDYCLWHCKHMALTQVCQHTPNHLLHGKAEVVAYRSFYRDYYDALQAIIFQDFAESIGHRDILLFHDHFAGAFHVENNIVWVTIRGWEK